MTADQRACATPFQRSVLGTAAGLHARRAEIERAVGARIQDVAALPHSGDPDEHAGGRALVAALVGFSLDAIEREPAGTAPIVPTPVADHARRAARAGASLAWVLCRYSLACAQAWEFVAEEAARAGLANGDPALRRMRSALDTALERLAAAIEGEYARELDLAAASTEQRGADLLRKLLTGEPPDPVTLSDLDYDLHSSWHVGLIATGTGAREWLRRLKVGLGRQLLCLPEGEKTLAAWLGGQRRLAVAEIERMSSDEYPGGSFAIGEPCKGLEGWRLTHRQAQAAFGLAARRGERVMRYGDDMLLAATLQNDTLARSLERVFLDPLGEREDRRSIERRRTLRAYIDAQCNSTSAAFPLGVNRHTVERRVRAIERLLGRPVRTCLTELDVALRLGELDSLAPVSSARRQTP